MDNRECEDMAKNTTLMLELALEKIEDYLRLQASNNTRGTATWDERAKWTSAEQLRGGESM